MSKATLYWSRVRTKEIELQALPRIYITSIFQPELPDSEQREGVTCAAEPKLAAQRIIDGTHRLATEDEIEKCLGDQKMRAEQCRAATELLNREQSLRMTSAFTEAAKRLGPNPAR